MQRTALRESKASIFYWKNVAWRKLQAQILHDSSEILLLLFPAPFSPLTLRGVIEK
jgi:hypothetical protein